MENCLVTRLKTTVQNDNLPVLETMQQFTLDAITLSANSSMTNDQKWALNHFFYQVGAIDNNALWGKIKYLGLPLISGDNIPTALNDYKNAETIAAENGSLFQNHGVLSASVVLKSGTFSMSTYDVSVLYMIMGTSISTTGIMGLMVDSGSNTDRATFPMAKASAYDKINFAGSSILRFGTLTPLSVEYTGAGGSGSDQIIDIAAFTNRTADANMRVQASSNGYKNINSANTTQMNNRNTECPEVTYTNQYLRCNLSNEYFGIVLIGSAFTDDEMGNVMDACAGLKNAFGA